MIKIKKRTRPNSIEIKNASHYRNYEVFFMLIDDQHYNCYICGDSIHTSVNIEHIVPHRKNPNLQFDWSNLLISCVHCNKVKHDKYENIIDPAIEDPEKMFEMHLEWDDELRKTVKINIINNNLRVNNTVELLNAVWNDTNTPQKSLASHNLKEKLRDELLIFYKKINLYELNPSFENKIALEIELADHSCFVAFKRTIMHKMKKNINFREFEIN